MVTVLVDAQNVRRSLWPNLSPDELETRCGAWADAEGVDVLVVFEPPGGSADDVIAAEAAQRASEGEPYWLVTSDRELRSRAGGAAERTIGGGAFARELTGRTA